MSTELISSGSSAVQRKAASDALYIFHGACNGLAVSKALTEAYRAFGPGTDKQNTSAPVCLILIQLCHLANMDVDVEFFECDEWLKECEKIAGFKLVDGVKEQIDGSTPEEVPPEREHADLDARDTTGQAAQDEMGER